jgi:hypothetical protein
MRVHSPLLVAALSIALASCSATTKTIEPASTSPLGSTVAPKGKAIALPGPCVDPIRDARARFGADADAAGVKSASIDLDVDGTPDTMISHESFCGTGGCAWHLYVVRGACGHHVGELFAVLPIAEPSSRHLGLVDLDVTVRNGCAGLARTEERARFDGEEYVADRTRTCRCPDDDDDGHLGDDPDPDRYCDDWHDPKAPGGK